MKCIAALEDKQLLEDKKNQSLRPDVDLDESSPQISQPSVSVTSILAKFSTVPPVAQPPMTVSSANTPPDDPSPPPSPIASPQFSLASIPVDDNDIDEAPPIPDHRDLLLGVSGLHTSESEGVADEYGGSEGEDGENVPGKDSMAADI